MSKNPPGPVSAYLRLGKVTISVPVALTGFLGYFLYKPELDQGAVLTILGVFFLSLASGSINQIQERKTDALMKRTAGRPIPAGLISMMPSLFCRVRHQ